MLRAKKTKTELEETISKVHESMATLTPDDPDYAKHVEQLAALYKIKDPKSENRVGLRDWIPVIGSIGGVLVIVAYESLGHTVTSKALSFVAKTKV